tara:strand:+ start:1588 stop:1821 length:234 start_codon:yes stop_codon:yes gene_type:complete
MSVPYSTTVTSIETHDGLVRVRALEYGTHIVATVTEMNPITGLVEAVATTALTIIQAAKLVAALEVSLVEARSQADQ